MGIRFLWGQRNGYPLLILNGLGMLQISYSSISDLNLFFALDDFLKYKSKGIQRLAHQ